MHERPIAHEPQFLAESKNFTVYKLLDKGSVLKIRKSFLKQRDDESNEEFSLRRQQDAIQYITEKSKNEDELARLIASLAPDVVVLKHEWLIMKASDGYPTVAKIQEFVKGVTLKDYGVDRLSQEQQHALATLMNASTECMRLFGRHIDLVGSDLMEQKSEKLSSKLTQHALAKSVNIFVREDGRLCLIDIQKGKSGKLLNIAKLIKYTFDSTFR